MIRPVHIRNLARRQGFGNVSRLSGNPKLYEFVCKILLEHAHTLLQQLVDARMAHNKRKVSFDAVDVHELFPNGDEAS